MSAFLDFVAVVLSGVALVAMATGVGGAVFVTRVLKRDTAPAIYSRALLVVVVGAASLALARTAALVALPLSYLDDPARLALADLFGTDYAQATIAQAAAAGVLAFTAASLRGPTATAKRSLQMAAAALLTVACGAWLTHASSRVEGAIPLTIATLAHQLGAAIWVGGIVELAFLRPLVKGQGSLWPQMLARFSPLALSAVLLLIAAGVALAWQYIGEWNAVIGTGYGAMVLAKVALLGVALALGSRNYLATRRWRGGARDDALERRVPAYIEAELAIVVCALLTAASLTSQPPAIDVPGERASAAEVLGFLGPKKPTLAPPPRDALLASASSTADAFATPSAIEHEQNNFNHNMAGLLVLIVALAAGLDRTGKVAAARHWPLAFLTLAAFVFFFAEPTVWPMGPEPFWATLAVPAVLQHRLAVLVVIGLALFEWRVRVGGLALTRWRFVFPLLCIGGGAMLLTHSHTVFRDATGLPDRAFARDSRFPRGAGRRRTLARDQAAPARLARRGSRVDAMPDVRRLSVALLSRRVEKIEAQRTQRTRRKTKGEFLNAEQRAQRKTGSSFPTRGSGSYREPILNVENVKMHSRLRGNDGF